MKNEPIQATIRSYQVGFGDCFLLTFEYAEPIDGRKERHVLIDCGSTAPPSGYKNAKGPFSLLPVAADIANVCGGKLDAVIATHRHKDHISGFATVKGGKGSGDVIRKLKPNLVLQPWTEDPDLPKDAKKAFAAQTKTGKPMALSQHFALGMIGMSQFCAGLLAELTTLKPALGARIADQLSFLGEDNLANLSAVKNLMTMAGKSGNEYLHYGMSTRLEKVLPGVKIHVLGPPTIEQNAGIQQQRSSDAAEFWQLRGTSAQQHVAGATSPFAARYRATIRPPEVRWIIPRLQASRAAQLLELVRILDDQMNNTSLILLFEFGKKKLLFPGDAQIENWNHALKDAKEAKANRALLAETDFYKVGHHGSRNATPRTLWGLFKKKGAAKVLQTMMSTRAGKHGTKEAKTEVPRVTLLEELEKNSTLRNTEDLGPNKFGINITVIK